MKFHFGRKADEIQEVEKQNMESASTGNLEEALYPLKYMSGYLQERTSYLLKEELNTTDELNNFEESFEGVREKEKLIANSINAFDSNLEELSHVSVHFSESMKNILEIIRSAKTEIDNLEDNTHAINTSFELIENTFKSVIS